MRIIDTPSPNFDERPKGTVIDTVIIHYTGMKTREEALDRLCDPKAENRVSSHFTIDREGTLYTHVLETNRAWHAGESYWDRKHNLNNNSIGIELVNRGHDHGYQDFPQEQIDSLVELLRHLTTHFPIRQDCILANSDIAPDRKRDPGEKFPWKELSTYGFGPWPKASALQEEAAKRILASHETLIKSLHEYGYNPDCSLENLILAFNRRFTGLNSNIMLSGGAAKLLGLIKWKREYLQTL